MSQQDKSRPATPLAQRAKVRVCQVRAMGSPAQRHHLVGTDLTTALDFGRLAAPLDAAGPLTPIVVSQAVEDRLTIEGPRIGSISADWMRLHLQTPASGLVDVRLFATDPDSIEATVDLLEDLRDEAVVGEPASPTYDGMAEYDDRPLATRPFHQLTFLPAADPEDEPRWEDVQRLIYRADLEAIEEQSSISQPVEMNRRPGQLAAVGSLGTVGWGLQDYIEPATVLSATLGIASLDAIQTVRLRSVELWRQAQELVGPVSAQRTTTPANLRSEVGWLQAGLAFSVLPSSVVSPLVQSVRVESYHQALYDVADVLTQHDQVSQMLDRLAGMLAVRRGGGS
ncbi:MAG: hypothetical protein AAF962_18995 [Actinomycetota bacterium]